MKYDIGEITKSMRFDRKSPVAAREKARYAALENATGEAMRTLQHAHLMLWHAVAHGDYHSLSLDDARKLLREAAQKIDAALDADPGGENSQ